MRDATLGDTLYFKFPTRAFATGIPTTLAGAPVAVAYEDNNLTQISAGVSLSVDHDGLTGSHLVTVIATSGNGFEAGKYYNLTLTAGTVGGVSVVGESIAEFTLQSGAAAVDLANATDGLTATKAVVDSRMAEASINTTSGSVDLVTNVFNNVGITQAGADRVWLSTIRQLSATGLDLITVGSTFVFALIKGVWDRVLTGATHNINNSAGRKLRQVGVMVLTSGTAQAGSANTITLATTDSTTDNIYQGDRVTITGGTGQEEHGIITAYVGATRVATMSKNWTIAPDNTSEYELSVATVDVESWGHVPTTVSATTQKPEVDAISISDSAAAADAVEANISNLDSPISEMLDDGTATYDRVSDSLQAIRDRGDAAWAGGGGGTSDWTVAEKENIRSALGVDGTKTAASGGQLQAIPTTPMRGTDGANTVVPLAAASTATQAKQDTAQTDLDALTGADGAVLATLQPNYAPNTQTPLTAVEVNAEVDAALNTAIPGSPAANSINERITAVDGAVSEARMAELDAANMPADLDTLISGVTVTTNNDKSGYTISIGGFPVGGFAAGAMTNAATSIDFETAIRDSVWAKVVEAQGAYTAQQVMSIGLAVLAGVTDTGGAVIRTPDGVSIRVSATTNGSNERTAMSTTPSA